MTLKEMIDRLSVCNTCQNSTKILWQRSNYHPDRGYNIRREENHLVLSTPNEIIIDINSGEITKQNSCIKNYSNVIFFSKCRCLIEKKNTYCYSSMINLNKNITDINLSLEIFYLLFNEKYHELTINYDDEETTIKYNKKSIELPCILKFDQTFASRHKLKSKISKLLLFA